MQRRLALQTLAALAGTTVPAARAADPPAPASAPVPPSAAALRDEVDLVRELLQTLHPGLYRYNTPAALEARRPPLREAYAAAPDLRTRYLLLSELLATLRCGHSYASFYNQRKAVAAELFDRPTRLPFHFRWLQGRMVVTGGVAPGLALAPGTTVEAIDGMSADALWQRLLPYVRVDGHNEGKARSLLSVSGNERLALFDVFHGLVLGPPAGGVYKLTVRDTASRQRTIEAPALTMAQRHAAVPPAPAADAPLWTWRPDASGRVAVLHMPTWVVYNSRWDWRGWLAERLDDIAGSQALRGLVVDLRGNEGGLDCGHPLIERFATGPSALPTRRLVRYRRVPAALNPVLDTWDDGFRDWGEQAQRVDERYYELPAGDTTLQPRAPRIDKPLVVLIDSANSSATFGFAERLRRARIGTLVGETTGGNQRGINGGAFFFARLPASGIEFDLPLIGYFPPEARPDGGLVPDVAVLPTPEDLAAGRDVQMAAALALAMR